MNLTVQDGGVTDDGAVIKVIGVGGGGNNAVRYMAANSIDGVDFICANTDAQALRGVGATKTIQLGVTLTKGLGAGANPDIGRKAAVEDRDKIVEILTGTDMVFITTGMGGGTGTGATPVIASIAKEMGILTVAVVTRPFPFEGKKRGLLADAGIKELHETVDSLITIPNEKLLELLGKDASLISAFAKADDVLCGAVRGISDIIKRPGMINVDFADVKAVMSNMGLALMGTGTATGPNRAREATEAAIHNPLLATVNLKGAKGILVNITAGPDLSLGEYSAVGQIIEDLASDDAVVKVGTVVDPNMRDELHVTVVATGLDLTPVPEKQSAANSIPAIRPSLAHAETEQHARPAPQPAHQPQPQHYEQPARTLNPGSYQPHSEPRSRGNHHPHLPQEQDQWEQNSITKPATTLDLDYLDIPAFLRKKQEQV